MRRVKKPWGREIIWAETSSYVGKILIINPGHRLSKQYHEEKEETLYVLEGILLNYLEEKVEKYFPGQKIHVNPKQIHRFGAPEDRRVKVVEVSTNYLEDVVRLEDDYER